MLQQAQLEKSQNKKEQTVQPLWTELCQIQLEILSGFSGDTVLFGLAHRCNKNKHSELKFFPQKVNHFASFLGLSRFFCFCLSFWTVQSFKQLVKMGVLFLLVWGFDASCQPQSLTFVPLERNCSFSTNQEGEQIIQLPLVGHDVLSFCAKMAPRFWANPHRQQPTERIRFFVPVSASKTGPLPHQCNNEELCQSRGARLNCMCVTLSFIVH